MKLDAATPFKTLLKAALDDKSKVDLWLRNGLKFAGKVAAIGDDTVVLADQPGRELFEVAILIAEIAAIETRAR